MEKWTKPNTLPVLWHKIHTIAIARFGQQASLLYKEQWRTDYKPVDNLWAVLVD